MVSNNVAVVGNVTLGASSQIVSLNGIELASAADEVQAAGNATISGNFNLNGGNIAGPAAGNGSLSITGNLIGGGTITGNVALLGVFPDGPSTQVWFPVFPTSHPQLSLTDATFNIASATSYDTVIVHGRILLDPNSDGLLTVNLVDGFTPVAGDSFELFQSTTDTIINDFAGDDFATLPGNLTWNWVPSTGTLSVLAVVPEPADYALIFGASLLGLLLLRRRAREKQVA